MKAFRSDVDETVRFRIKPKFGEPGVYLELKENGRTATAVLPAGSAPALALAILEAAYGSDQPAPYKVGEAWAALYAHIAEEESRAADAKDLEELEAEALELRNAFSLAIGGASIDSFAGHSVNKPGWIDAARRAREMRAEK